MRGLVEHSLNIPAELSLLRQQEAIHSGRQVMTTERFGTRDLGGTEAQIRFSAGQDEKGDLTRDAGSLVKSRGGVPSDAYMWTP